MPQGPQLNDFLNPNSMITPGAAGGITMIITNTLCNQFALPGNWTALVISFLLGTLTMIYSVGLLQRAGYFVINSLIIYVMAFGANALGVSASHNKAEAQNGARHTAIMRVVPSDRTVFLASYEIPAPRFYGRDFRASPSSRGLQLAGGDESDKKQNKSSGFFRTWSWTGG